MKISLLALAAAVATVRAAPLSKRVLSQYTFCEYQESIVNYATVSQFKLRIYADFAQLSQFFIECTAVCSYDAAHCTGWAWEYNKKYYDY